MKISNLIRPDIQAMEAYTPIKPFDVLSRELGHPVEAIIKLDANENPYGPSPDALAALTKLASVTHIYPDPQSTRLREAISRYVDVPVEHILAGAGADELIDLIMRLFIQPGDAILNCPPTFGMYAFDGALNGAQVINVPRQPDFSLDVVGIETSANAHQPKLLFLCSPNNPNGSLIDRITLERLLKLPLVVVLDEAYIEFADVDSAVQLATECDNLIVLRTFSKWAGLAGLRVGYGVFPLGLMDHLWKMKQPYNVNVAAEAAALASLGDVDTLLQRVDKIREERGRLYQALQTIPYLEPYPSRANFILCRVLGRDAGELKQSLAKDDAILIRYFNKPGLNDHIRVSVGKPDQTDALITALEART